MFFRRLSLPTKLYLAVSLPIALTFVLSAIAYVGLGQVLEDVRSKSDSDLVFERLTELSVVIERTGRLMGEPGSQQQVQARLTPVVARFKELAATVSESDAVRDRGIADRLAAEAGRLDEFVHATMLARGNITEAQLLLPSALASFAEVSMQMSAGLGGLAAADAVPLNATFSQQASALLDAAGSYASQLDKAQFESVRQVISDFSDQIEKSARALKSAGQDGRALERSMERSRSKIYGLVMQLGAATDRFDTLGAQVTGILDEARQAAATLKSLGHAAEAAQVARMSWWAGAIALGALLALAIGFGMAILMPVLISRGIVKPLGALERTMKALAKGDTDVQVGGTSRHDAIGSMALAVVVFRDSIRETERLRADKAEETRRSAERRQTELHRFADQFHSAVGPMIETVSSAATELEAAAGNLAAIADHTQQLSTSAANAFAQASANVQIVAEATESLGSSIGEIAHQTERSNTIATQAVHQADATNLRIGELSQAADRIGDVVNLISAIAGQTNLLALNAAIEFGSRRGSRKRLCGGRSGGQGAGCAYRDCHPRHRYAGRRNPDRNGGLGVGDRGDRRDDQAHFRHRFGDPQSGGGAGSGVPADRQERSASDAGDFPSCRRHRRCQPRCARNRSGIVRGVGFGAIVVERERPAEG